MLEASSIELVVFDVLGTMVDEPGGLRAAIRDAVPASDDASVNRMLSVWQEHVEHVQRRIAEGARPFTSAGVVDREAAGRVAEHAGGLGLVTIEVLATAGHRLEPWDDSIAGLTRLARRFPVLGLSNANRTMLLRLNAYAGLRWHQALSAEEAGAYEPAPEVYQLEIDASGCPLDRILMVAAHAWDLRGVQAVGMRTAYVQRLVGDPPTGNDAFDGHFNSLDALATALKAQPFLGGVVRLAQAEGHVCARSIATGLTCSPAAPSRDSEIGAAICREQLTASVAARLCAPGLARGRRHRSAADSAS